MQYLQDYASDLYPMMRFEHDVVDVRQTNGDESRGWKFTTRVTAEEEVEVERFVAVIAPTDIAINHCCLMSRVLKLGAKEYQLHYIIRSHTKVLKRSLA